jgi:hypothetical protein
MGQLLQLFGYIIKKKVYKHITTLFKEVGFSPSKAMLILHQANLLQPGENVSFSISFRHKKKFQTRHNSFQRVCLTSWCAIRDRILMLMQDKSCTTEKGYIFDSLPT